MTWSYLHMIGESSILAANAFSTFTSMKEDEDLSSQNDKSSSKETNSSNVLSVGQTVLVDSRTWPGINKPGGSGRIKMVHKEIDSEGKEIITYDIAYLVGRQQEKGVDAEYVHYVDLTSGMIETTRNRSARVFFSEEFANEYQSKHNRVPLLEDQHFDFLEPSTYNNTNLKRPTQKRRKVMRNEEVLLFDDTLDVNNIPESEISPKSRISSSNESDLNNSDEISFKVEQPLIIKRRSKIAISDLESDSDQESEEDLHRNSTIHSSNYNRTDEKLSQKVYEESGKNIHEDRIGDSPSSGSDRVPTRRILRRRRRGTYVGGYEQRSGDFIQPEEDPAQLPEDVRHRTGFVLAKTKLALLQQLSEAMSKLGNCVATLKGHQADLDFKLGKGWDRIDDNKSRDTVISLVKDARCKVQDLENFLRVEVIQGGIDIANTILGKLEKMKWEDELISLKVQQDIDYVNTDFSQWLKIINQKIRTVIREYSLEEELEDDLNDSDKEESSSDSDTYDRKRRRTRSHRRTEYYKDQVESDPKNGENEVFYWSSSSSQAVEDPHEIESEYWSSSSCEAEIEDVSYSRRQRKEQRLNNQFRSFREANRNKKDSENSIRVRPTLNHPISKRRIGQGKKNGRTERMSSHFINRDKYESHLRYRHQLREQNHPNHCDSSMNHYRSHSNSKLWRWRQFLVPSTRTPNQGTKVRGGDIQDSSRYFSNSNLHPTSIANGGNRASMGGDIVSMGGDIASIRGDIASMEDDQANVGGGSSSEASSSMYIIADIPFYYELPTNGCGKTFLVPPALAVIREESLDECIVPLINKDIPRYHEYILSLPKETDDYNTTIVTLFRLLRKYLNRLATSSSKDNTSFLLVEIFHCILSYIYSFIKKNVTGLSSNRLMEYQVVTYSQLQITLQSIPKVATFLREVEIVEDHQCESPLLLSILRLYWFCLQYLMIFQIKSVAGTYHFAWELCEDILVFLFQLYSIQPLLCQLPQKDKHQSGIRAPALSLWYEVMRTLCTVSSLDIPKEISQLANYKKDSNRDIWAKLESMINTLQASLQQLPLFQDMNSTDIELITSELVWDLCIRLTPLCKLESTALFAPELYSSTLWHLVHILLHASPRLPMHQNPKKTFDLETIVMYERVILRRILVLSEWWMPEEGTISGLLTQLFQRLSFTPHDQIKSYMLDGAGVCDKAMGHCGSTNWNDRRSCKCSQHHLLCPCSVPRLCSCRLPQFLLNMAESGRFAISLDSFFPISFSDSSCDLMCKIIYVQMGKLSSQFKRVKYSSGLLECLNKKVKTVAELSEADEITQQKQPQQQNQWDWKNPNPKCKPIIRRRVISSNRGSTQAIQSLLCNSLKSRLISSVVAVLGVSISLPFLAEPSVEFPKALLNTLQSYIKIVRRLIDMDNSQRPEIAGCVVQSLWVLGSLYFKMRAPLKCIFGEFNSLLGLAVKNLSNDIVNLGLTHLLLSCILHLTESSIFLKETTEDLQIIRRVNENITCALSPSLGLLLEACGSGTLTHQRTLQVALQIISSAIQTSSVSFDTLILPSSSKDDMIEYDSELDDIMANINLPECGIHDSQQSRKTLNELNEEHMKNVAGIVKINLKTPLRKILGYYYNLHPDGHPLPTFQEEYLCLYSLASCILFISKEKKHSWNQIRQEYDPLQSVWTLKQRSFHIPTRMLTNILSIGGVDAIQGILNPQTSTTAFYSMRTTKDQSFLFIQLWLMATVDPSIPNPNSKKELNPKKQTSRIDRMVDSLKDYWQVLTEIFIQVFHCQSSLSKIIDPTLIGIFQDVSKECIQVPGLVTRKKTFHLVCQRLQQVQNTYSSSNSSSSSSKLFGMHDGLFVLFLTSIQRGFKQLDDRLYSQVQDLSRISSQILTHLKRAQMRSQDRKEAIKIFLGTVQNNHLSQTVLFIDFIYDCLCSMLETFTAVSDGDNLFDTLLKELFPTRLTFSLDAVQATYAQAESVSHPSRHIVYVLKFWNATQCYRHLVVWIAKSGILSKFYDILDDQGYLGIEQYIQDKCEQSHLCADKILSSVACGLCCMDASMEETLILNFRTTLFERILPEVIKCGAILPTVRLLGALLEHTLEISSCSIQSSPYHQASQFRSVQSFFQQVKPLLSTIFSLLILDNKFNDISVSTSLISCSLHLELCLLFLHTLQSKEQVLEVFHFLKLFLLRCERITRIIYRFPDNSDNSDKRKENSPCFEKNSTLTNLWKTLLQQIPLQHQERITIQDTLATNDKASISDPQRNNKNLAIMHQQLLQNIRQLGIMASQCSDKATQEMADIHILAMFK